MRPLTLNTPKPLLLVNGVPLIEHTLMRLRTAGVVDIVINVAYLAEQIMQVLGDGSRLGLNIQYSLETEPLETGGGINQALNLLGNEPFLLLNSDIWTDYPLQRLMAAKVAVAGAHMVLVPNPPFKQKGDFDCNAGGRVTRMGAGLTFSGMSQVHPDLIRQYPAVRRIFPLREALAWALENQRLTAEYYAGEWVDVGTPERLAQINKHSDN